MIGRLVVEVTGAEDINHALGKAIGIGKQFYGDIDLSVMMTSAQPRQQIINAAGEAVGPLRFDVEFSIAPNDE